MFCLAPVTNKDAKLVLQVVSQILFISIALLTWVEYQSIWALTLGLLLKSRGSLLEEKVTSVKSDLRSRVHKIPWSLSCWSACSSKLGCFVLIKQRAMWKEACFTAKLLFFLAVPHGMWDLKCPTRDWALVPCSERTVLTAGPPRKSLVLRTWWMAGVQLMCMNSSQRPLISFISPPLNPF